MQDVCKSIEEYKPVRKSKVLIVIDEMVKIFDDLI